MSSLGRLRSDCEVCLPTPLPPAPGYPPSPPRSADILPDVRELSAERDCELGKSGAG